MLESFTHGGEMADLVIDDGRDRGDISNGGSLARWHLLGPVLGHLV